MCGEKMISVAPSSGFLLSFPPHIFSRKAVKETHMSKAPFLPLATDAFIGDTTGLNAAETGAYMMLLICQWRNNGEPLDNNPKKLQRMTRCTKAQFNRVWPEIEHFFEINETTISQKRIEKNFLEVLKKIEVKRQSGKRGGRPKSLNYNEAVEANGSISLKLTESETKATINQNHKLEPDNNTNALLGDGGFKFSGKIIKLNYADYARWKKAYHAIPDFEAQLQSADDWISGESASNRKRWFNVISGMLSNKHSKFLMDGKKSGEEIYPRGKGMM